MRVGSRGSTPTEASLGLSRREDWVWDALTEPDLTLPPHVFWSYDSPAIEVPAQGVLGVAFFRASVQTTPMPILAQLILQAQRDHKPVAVVLSADRDTDLRLAHAGAEFISPGTFMGGAASPTSAATPCPPPAPSHADTNAS